ncbi:MAG: sugar ABC transporter permease [Metamycoplasmataceae bacterium]
MAKLKKTNIKVPKDEMERKINLSDDIKLNILGKAKLGMAYTLLICWSVIILVPILGLVIASFNVSDPQFINLTDIQLGIDNFQKLFEKENGIFVRWLVNSLVVSILTMILTILFVSLTGYAYSRFRFKGRKASILSIMLIQMVPSLLALIVLYIISQLLKESFGIPAIGSLIIIYSGGSIAGNTFVLKGYLDSISNEIDDSAKIDGCGNFKAYIRIIMPLARPMLAIIGLWSFIGPFGDVILPRILLLGNRELYTLPIGLFELLSPDSNRLVFQPLYAAGALITSIPIACAFIYSQKHLVSGLSSGGVKG